MIYNKCINDMPKGWTRANESNWRIYQLWFSMITRCYSERELKRCPTYKGCYVCERWLKLSNFLEDLPKIDGYELWLNNPNKRISLDKDIKSNGKNKCYCLENCIFVTASDNSIQSNKTMNYIFTEERNKKVSESNKGKHKGIKNQNLGLLICQYTIKGEIINIKYQFEYIEMGFWNVSKCCKGKCKSVGKGKGTEKFIFKYIDDVKDNDIKKYIIKYKQIKIGE